MLTVVKVDDLRREGYFFAGESMCNREAVLGEMELAGVSSVGCDGLEGA